MSVIGRYEALGDLYYRAHLRLRPGKDDRPRDSSDPENVALFENYVATRAFVDALDRIEVLQNQVEKLEAELEAKA